MLVLKRVNVLSVSRTDTYLLNRLLYRSTSCISHTSYVLAACLRFDGTSIELQANPQGSFIA
jgi:hypothetical protein